MLWAEWSKEEEFKWAAELLLHDREWGQRLAEKERPPWCNDKCSVRRFR
jgi:hypothetical protein